MLSFAMLSFAMLSFTMLSFAMLSFAMLSFVMLSFVMLSFFAALGLSHRQHILIAERVNCTLSLHTVEHAQVEKTIQLGGTSSVSSSSIVVILAC